MMNFFFLADTSSFFFVFHFIQKQILVMMITQLTIFVVIFTILSSFIIAEDPCRFSHTKGVIDISSLAREDGLPKYADQIPPTGSNYSMLMLFFVLIFLIQYLLIVEYSYNPCKPFSEGASCRNVAACQG